MDCLLVFLMSFDALLAATTLGAKQITLQRRARLVIAAIGTGCLAVSFSLSQVLAVLLPTGLFHALSCGALLLMALACLFEAALKRLSGWLAQKCVTVRLLGLRFVLHIYAETAQADIDRSGSLSPREAALLALPLSFDSLLTGLSIGGTSLHRLCLLALSFACGIAAVTAGEWFGRRLGRAAGEHTSLISGVGLLVIALIKAF